MNCRFFLVVFSFISVILLSGCPRNYSVKSQPKDPNPNFRVWWIQSFYPAETEAISGIIADWEKANNVKVELTYYNDASINIDTQNAVNNGAPPELVFSNTAEYALISSLAWNDKLSDLSELLKPSEELFDKSALQSVFYQNGRTKERHYYAAPLAQLTLCLHYWRNLMTEYGVNNKPLPRDWEGFWNLFETIQTKARQKGKKDLFGIGLGMSRTGDVMLTFEQFLSAYQVDFMTTDGQLKLDDPIVKSRIIAAITKYTGFYKAGFAPINATEWNDYDNNTCFLNKNCVMTVNPGLSIPASQQYDHETYAEKIVTTEWPSGVDGQPLEYAAAIKQAFILKDSAQTEMAKRLLKHIIKPENLLRYLKGAGGRYLPTMPSLLKDPFFQDSLDSHIQTAAKQLQKTRPFYSARHPAYAEVNSKEVWGRAILSIATGELSPEQAVETAITEIKQIFKNWR